MTFKHSLVYIGKLILCGASFSLGLALGGLVASALNLPRPTPPPGVDANTAGLYLALTSPLLALGLSVVARHLAGGYVTRSLVLSFFMWITYSVNTQLEASIVSTFATGIWFAMVVFLFACLFCGATVARLFPSDYHTENFFHAAKAYFAHRAAWSWAWRLPLAAVVFMPIYFAFGLMVLPYTGEYYRQNMFGLAAPTIEQLLPILFLRSLLFFVACLPIFILWRSSARSAFWRLGIGLFTLVGFVLMLTSTWLPSFVRFPHMLEILADEFVYAGALTLLLIKIDLPQPLRHP